MSEQRTAIPTDRLLQWYGQMIGHADGRREGVGVEGLPHCVPICRAARRRQLRGESQDEARHGGAGLRGQRWLEAGFE